MAMKTDDIGKYGRLIRRKVYRFDRKILIYIFFLIISGFLWLISSLSRQYSTTITYPVKYINYPTNYASLNTLPKELNLKIFGYGYNLLQYKWSTPSFPIIIDLKKKFAQKKSNHVVFAIATTNEIPIINSQVGSLIEIQKIEPDTIFFDFTKVAKKKVQVKSAVTLNLDPKFAAEGDLQIKPAWVTISGPYPMIDTIDFVSTENIVFDRINHNIKKTVSLVSFENVEMEPSEVTLDLKIEKFTETSIQVPLKIKNLPQNLQMHVFPKTIKVTFSCGLSKCKNIQAKDFNFAIDYNEAIKNKGNQVEVKMLKKPEDAKDIHFTPKNVEFLIEK